MANLMCNSQRRPSKRAGELPHGQCDWSCRAGFRRRRRLSTGSEREFPDPGPGQVRIRVQACGVCHSDSITKLGLFPGIQYPRVPGHEVAGVVDAVGPGEPLFKPGQRVGLGWHGGHCNYCVPCRHGDFILCENQLISGISFDGGYADYVIAPANAWPSFPTI